MSQATTRPIKVTFSHENRHILDHSKQLFALTIAQKDGHKFGPRQTNQ